MSYDIDALQNKCTGLGVDYNRVSADEIEVIIEADCVLYFANLAEEGDTIMGFKDVMWHTHDELVVMCGDDCSISLNELEVIECLEAGILLIVSRWIDGKINDRWLMHKDEKLDLKDVEQNEELRIKRMA